MPTLLALRPEQKRGSPPPEAAWEVPNVVWQESWCGRFATARGEAALRVGARSARLRVPAARQTATGALRANAYLPANVRYSGPRHESHLVADAWIDPEALPASVLGFRVGVRRVRPQRKSWSPVEVGEEGACTELLDDMARSGADIDVVPTPPGWEVGPRVRGRRVAVRLSPEPDGLRCYRTVLATNDLAAGGAPDCHESIADAALRMNANIRWVRFAIHDSGLAVEARLPAPVLDLPRLIETVQAIAVVSRELEPRLQLLMQHPDVARCYARIFTP